MKQTLEDAFFPYSGEGKRAESSHLSFNAIFLLKKKKASKNKCRSFIPVLQDNIISHLQLTCLEHE